MDMLGTYTFPCLIYAFASQVDPHVSYYQIMILVGCEETNSCEKISQTGSYRISSHNYEAELAEALSDILSKFENDADKI
jgi:hypothetical protein